MKLRFISLTDFTGLYNLLQRNKSFLEASFPKMIQRCSSTQQTEQFVIEKVQEQVYKKACYFVIEEANTTIRGLVSIRNVDWEIGKGEIAYFIDHQFQNQGHMNHALISVLHYAKQELKLNKLIGRVLLSNQASIRLLEKNKFEFEGKHRKEFKSSTDELLDIVYYGLLLNELN